MSNVNWEGQLGAVYENKTFTAKSQLNLFLQILTAS